MARTVTLLELRTWARQLSDTEGDVNITDSELTALANRHLCEVYDRLVDAGPPDYYSSGVTINVTSNNIEYALDVTFRNLTGVYVEEGTNEYRPIVPMPHGARGQYRPPTRAYNVLVEFIPIPDALVLDNDTFDGVSGFEELIANCMARDVMIKRESDPSVVLNNIARLEARIVSRGRNRDKWQPKRIADTDDLEFTPMYGWTGTARIACYRLRGGNIEFYELLDDRP